MSRYLTVHRKGVVREVQRICVAQSRTPRIEYFRALDRVDLTTLMLGSGPEDDRPHRLSSS